MLKQLDRLKLLYDHLHQGQADSNTLLAFLLEKKAEISLRQLQRDLNDIEKYFLKSAEKLIIRDGKSLDDLTFDELGVYLKHVEGEIE